MTSVQSGNVGDPTLYELENKLREVWDDLLELGTIIGKYKINTGNRKIRTCEEARDLILSYIDTWKSQQIRNMEYLESRRNNTLKFLRRERGNQLRCQQFFEDARTELLAQDKFVVCNLQLQYTDFEKEVLRRHRMLEEGSLRILITGEICAGKSSVLNLLMGGHYMAVGHGPCTQIPCEVRHSRELKAVLYYADTRFNTRNVTVDTDENAAVWGQLRQCMEKGEDVLDECEQRTWQKLRKIVIHWKFPFLLVSETIENDLAAVEDKLLYGVSFLDVPGIHDTDETFVNMFEYIDSSDAFMFVINNSEHSGLDKDRLLRLMDDVRKKFEKKNGMFSPICALFVCNKWDRVPDSIRNSLKKTIHDKLHDSWSRVSDKQITTVTSSSEAVRRTRSGVYDDEYVHFEYRLCAFLENVVRLKTEVATLWLSVVLDKTIAAARNMENFISIAEAKKREIVEQLRKDEEYINDTREKIQQKEKKLNEYLQDRMDNLRKYLERNLKENRKLLTAWHSEAIPKVEKDKWIKTSVVINESIGQKIENYIIKDHHVKLVIDETNKRVDYTLNEVIKLYTQMDDNLAFANQIPDEKFRDLADLMTATDTGLSWQEIAGVVVAVVFPLAPIVVLLLAAIDKIRTPSLLDDPKLFQKDCYGYMAHQTSIIINHVINSGLPQVSEALLDTQIKNSQFAFKYFLHCLQIRQQMTVELGAQIENIKKPTGKRETLSKLSDQMQHFLVEYVRPSEIDDHCIRFDPVPSNCLGSGAFGAVYKGTFIGDIDITPVAVKVVRMPVDRGSAPEDTYFYRECFMLRMLSVKPAALRANVVDYLGHFTEASSSDHKLNLVFELCDSNLESLIKCKKLMLPGIPECGVDFPGRDATSDLGVAFIIHLSRQAASGIQFLHHNQIVHRDIKPHNFLIKFCENDVVVKVCDFGLSRPGDLVKTLRSVGTVLYNDPDVLAGRPHTYASDIYSLGLVIWELWYGERVFQELSDNAVKDPKRKTPEMKPFVPVDTLRNLLQKMFSKKPEHRPEVDTVVKDLRKLEERYPVTKTVQGE